MKLSKTKSLTVDYPATPDFDTKQMEEIIARGPITYKRDFDVLTFGLELVSLSEDSQNGLIAKSTVAPIPHLIEIDLPSNREKVSSS